MTLEFPFDVISGQRQGEISIVFFHSKVALNLGKKASRTANQQAVQHLESTTQVFSNTYKIMTIGTLTITLYSVFCLLF